MAWNWAEDDDSWEDGYPGIGLFARAVQVWAIMQKRDVTIDEAANAFCVQDKTIREAVDFHPWMFIGENDRIEHEGE